MDVSGIVDAAKPEQVMSPSGPAMAMVSSTSPRPGVFSSNGPRPPVQETLGATIVAQGSGFLPSGQTGAEVSSAVGGTAEDIPQTTTQRLGSQMQTQAGGLQLEVTAQATQDQLL